MTVVQARVPSDDVAQLDRDLAELGLTSRSAAVREGLRLIHRQAQHAALARDYDEFYGAGHPAPLGDVAALGDQIAADSIAARESDQ